MRRVPLLLLLALLTAGLVLWFGLPGVPGIGPWPLTRGVGGASSPEPSPGRENSSIAGDNGSQSTVAGESSAERLDQARERLELVEQRLQEQELRLAALIESRTSDLAEWQQRLNALEASLARTGPFLRMGRVVIGKGDLSLKMTDLFAANITIRKQVTFSRPMPGIPKILLSIGSLELEKEGSHLVPVAAEQVDASGFSLVVSSPGGNRIKSARITWLAVVEGDRSVPATEVEDVPGAAKKAPVAGTLPEGSAPDGESPVKTPSMGGEKFVFPGAGAVGGGAATGTGTPEGAEQ
ncbi:MAG: hypothetical protein HQL57_01600 [Magnetococcales bacterium]|nr:hypothetical protein [Magnetococcales bacterium]MBF0155864.1 hypothetical protein [Magnetococcales bacterium]